MSYEDLKFGVFLAGSHLGRLNTSLVLDEDMRLVLLLDDLGYDCVWFDENYAGGSEPSATAGVLAATVFEKANPIGLGTYISALGYHHPSALTDKIKHMTSLHGPAIEISVASQISPAGAKIAGTLDLPLLSLCATAPGDFNTLATSWEIYERNTSQKPAERSRWSLAGPVHIAETRERAFSNVRFGLDDWLAYFSEVTARPIVPTDTGDAAEALVESGLAVIGTADDAISQINRLLEQSGGFGTFLQLAHDWANWEETKKSYQLFSRYVAPAFQISDSRI